MSNIDSLHKDLINRIYFGLTDYRFEHDYLQDDICNNFKSQLKVWIISDILEYYSIPSVNGRIDSRYIDWDFSRPLVELLSSARTDSLVKMRIMLSKERFDAKGKMKRPLSKCSPGSQTGGSFLIDAASVADDNLKNKISAFEKAGYYDQLVTKNEKVLLHKDNGIYKRCHVGTETVGNVTINRYSSNTVFDSGIIIDAIEKISVITLSYLSDNTCRLRRKSVGDVDDYIFPYYKLFIDKDIDVTFAPYVAICKNVRLVFPNTIKLIGWK